MSSEKLHLGVVARLEPELMAMNPDAALASIAISLKRIADLLQNAEIGHVMIDPRPPKGATWEEITPEKAKAWLEINKGRLRLAHHNQTHVDRLVKEMTSGNWRWTVHSIKLAKDGTLLDGMHRLLACIEADKPLWVFVIRDVDETVFREGGHWPLREND